jgi:hypothetical protein
MYDHRTTPSRAATLGPLLVKSSPPDTGSDKEAIALLVRYQCPTPFHAVRTLLIGNIASPLLNASPMGALAQVWGGQMPAFASTDDVESVARVLLHGLWNRLAQHQSSRSPFRLTRQDVVPSRAGLHGFALMRQQELEGFVEGLFGSAQELSLPDKAHDSLGILAELRVMFAGMVELLADETTPAPAEELKGLVRNLQQVSLIAEAEINKAIQSCKRARGRHLEAMAAIPTSNGKPH